MGVEVSDNNTRLLSRLDSGSLESVREEVGTGEDETRKDVARKTRSGARASSKELPEETERDSNERLADREERLLRLPESRSFCVFFQTCLFSAYLNRKNLDYFSGKPLPFPRDG